VPNGTHQLKERDAHQQEQPDERNGHPKEPLNAGHSHRQMDENHQKQDDHRNSDGHRSCRLAGMNRYVA
jgi:hypothetical protein